MIEKTDYNSNFKNYDISKKFIDTVLFSDFPVHDKRIFTNKKYLPNTSYPTLCPDCVCCLQREGSSLEEYIDNDISYNLNNYAYRSDDFNKNNRTKFLFNGCSYTFGVGLPIDNIWPKVVYDQIGSGGFYNLGISGASYQSIIQNIYSYIRNFDKPENIFILLPNIERYDQIKKDGDNLSFSVVPYIDDFPEYKKIRSVLTPEYVIRDLVSQLRALEDYCEASGIALYWSAWDIRLDAVLSQANGLKRYVPCLSSPRANELLDFALKQGDKKHRYWDMAREGHPGIKDQLIYAKMFLDAYEKNNK